MGLNIAPTYRVKANDQDITDKIRDRLKSLRLTDETGDTADTLEISLADHIPEEPISIPPRGAELDVAIGYDGEARRMGLFVCDEIELSGFPGEMVIRARAAPFEASKGGKSDLQSQKTRTWAKGTTIGAMVRRIAGEHGMDPAVSAALSGIALPLVAQSQESDMNLLLRLAKQYDAIAKPAGGRLMFIKRGESQTASGQAMEKITFTPKDGSDYRVVISEREDAGTTVAYYRDTRKAKRTEVVIGKGEPVLRLRMSYADRVSAEEAARAKHRERARSTRRLTYSMPGRPEAVAEVVAVMEGFRDGVDGEWLIQRAEHYIGPDGYRTTIECELPNAATGGKADVEERAQTGTEIA